MNIIAIRSVNSLCSVSDQLWACTNYRHCAFRSSALSWMENKWWVYVSLSNHLHLWYMYMSKDRLSFVSLVTELVKGQLCWKEDIDAGSEYPSQKAKDYVGQSQQQQVLWLLVILVGQQALLTAVVQAWGILYACQQEHICRCEDELDASINLNVCCVCYSTFKDNKQQCTGLKCVQCVCGR